MLNPRVSAGEVLAVISSQVFSDCALTQRPGISEQPRSYLFNSSNDIRCFAPVFKKNRKTSNPPATKPICLGMF